MSGLRLCGVILGAAGTVLGAMLMHAYGRQDQRALDRSFALSMASALLLIVSAP